MSRMTITNEPEIIDILHELFDEIVQEWVIPDRVDFDTFQDWYIDYLKQLNAVAFRCGFEAGSKIKTKTELLIEYQKLENPYIKPQPSEPEKEG